MPNQFSQLTKTVADFVFLAKQWHPTKNELLKPSDVSWGSARKVWWMCDFGHEWNGSVNQRTSRLSGCPYCTGKKTDLENSFAVHYPDLAAQWHPTKNKGLTPYDVRWGSSRKVWWKCSVEQDHEWEAIISNRVRNPGCPCCGGDKVVLSNCLATTHPEIAAQWHPTLNGDLTPYDVSAGSSTYKRWWKCSERHDWEAKVNDRKRNGCPYCDNGGGFRKVNIENCLATTHPEISAQWHSTLNGDLTPYDITHGSTYKIWWNCCKQHEYQSTPLNRTSDNNCPYCDNGGGFRKANIENCLATTHPEIAAQWHSILNGDLTPYDITHGNRKLVWWFCYKQHEYQATANQRTNKCSGGSSCPICNESKGEQMIASILNGLGVCFKRQAKFKTCKHIRYLPFDFLIRITNKIGVLIEYNGIQHYSPAKWSKKMSDKKAQDLFESIQVRDKIKKEWAEKRHVPLLVVPYWDKNNLKQIISDFISKFSEGKQ